MVVLPAKAGGYYIAWKYRAVERIENPELPRLIAFRRGRIRSIAADNMTIRFYCS